jgi:chromosome partitioning protein
MYDKRTRASLAALKELQETYPNNIWNSVIPIDTKFRDASLRHTPPSYHIKNCRGVFAYQTLLAHLMQMRDDQGLL